MQKAKIESDETASPDQVALDETVVKIDGDIFLLYIAVEPGTIETLLTRNYPTRTMILTERFLHELRSEHDVEGTTFVVDGAPWLQISLDRCGLEYRHETVGDRTAVERV